MPWKPTVPGERPTLGFIALDWIETYLAAPDRPDYEPFQPTREQAEFILALYELDPETCKRTIRRAVLSRARGWGKSPFISAIAILEALGPVVPAGWDSDGQPVAMPWSEIRTPLVQLAAASEAQTKNAWISLREMLREDAPVFDEYDGLEVLGGFVNLPYAGRIEPITTSATSAKGNRPVAVFADQTEQWTVGNGSVQVFDVLRNNVAKVGGIIVETPNAYIPGMGSQAERTAKTFLDIHEGHNKRLTGGVLYDHREASGDTDITDPDSLTAGLRYAYGCSSDDSRGCVIHDPPCEPGWAPIQGFVQRFYETDAEEQDSRSDFLNQITHASDAWLSGPDWSGIADPTKVVTDGELITLGFDGSRGRVKGKPDATALIACRVSDGHLFEIGVWEAENLPATWDTWEPSIVEIEAAIAMAFDRYSIAAFYCDPGRDWRSHVNAWEARWSGQVRLRSRREHPFEWWMTGGRATAVQQAIEQLEGAIRNRDITQSGEYHLTQHVLAARRRLSHGKLALAKSNDYSVHKIDAAIAAVLAYQARLDAVTAGLSAQPKFVLPRRIR